MHRTHTCGELRKTDEGQEVTLSGWVSKPRDHGGVIFVDLRDRYGITQVVFNPDIKDFDEASKLRREDVIKVKGKVNNRKEGMNNPNLDTGDIELIVSDLTILNKSLTPPIEVDEHKIANEDARMKYRYLDLRRSSMQNNFVTRHKAALAARNYLNSEKFLEIETPLLVKATPEGARDYIVPSRVNAGKAYALPQSPQLYKQILMASGFDRYYQLARCLRDEDLRADRQPEFTQIDIEMSFAEQDDIFKVGEGMIKSIMKDTKNIDVQIPFPRISYKESMERFGNDKPDLRFGMELTEVTEIVKKSDFSVFKDVASKEGIVKCINPEKDIPRKEIDRYIEYCQSFGAKGMAWMRVTENGLESNIAKFFNEDVQKELIDAIGAKPGSILMFIADKKNKCNDVISRLRLKLGEDLELIDKDEFRFAWIIDFPLFEWNEDDEKWDPAHHMFTMPQSECMQYIESDPAKVFASCYDLVLNGVELASGSIRIHDPTIQQKVMDVVGFPKEEAEERFGFLLEAFKYGAPPHGGFAIGFDRLVAMIQGTTDIREVIAFPKNKSAECPMDGSPSNVDQQQLKDLHMKWDILKKS